MGIWCGRLGDITRDVPGLKTLRLDITEWQKRSWARRDSAAGWKYLQGLLSKIGGLRSVELIGLHRKEATGTPDLQPWMLSTWIGSEGVTGAEQEKELIRLLTKTLEQPDDSGDVVPIVRSSHENGRLRLEATTEQGTESSASTGMDRHWLGLDIIADPTEYSKHCS
ncbi:hypothetical protein LTR66_004817 [Elasticomyces elasticus]|nr:hypothetical protein LTR66_004817 [Elasticomyces elasticus]